MNDCINQLKQRLNAYDTVFIGAGSGLSAAAGYTYSGQRFTEYFADFIAIYPFTDMYTAGFYPYSTPEEHWAYWSRYIWINRWQDPPTPVYHDLLELVKEKDYFVLTTNVDHCFQKAGFDKRRLFYIQGDYGLFQCSEPCQPFTYENQAQIRQMLEAQGYEIKPDHSLSVPKGRRLKRMIPTSLVPHCPLCGRPMTMNLRSDHRFAEDAGWHQAAGRYEDFVKQHEASKILYLEIGVGYNTPSIIKYNFWHQVYRNPLAYYACINNEEAGVPSEITGRSICIKHDAASVLSAAAKKMGEHL